MTKTISIIILGIFLFLQADAYYIEAGSSTVREDSVYLKDGVFLRTDRYECNTSAAVLVRSDSTVIMNRQLRLTSGDSLIVDAQSGLYNDALKNFSLHRPLLSIDRLTVSSLRGVMDFDDSVYIFTDSTFLASEGFSIACDSFYRDNAAGKNYFTGSIAYYDSANDFTIEALYLDNSIEDSIYAFNDSVEIYNDSFSLYTDSLIYNKLLGSGSMPVHCLIKSEQTEITGDSAVFTGSAAFIDSIDVLGNVLFTGEDTEQKSTVQCDLLSITIVDGGINKIIFSNVSNAEIIIEKDD
ncbi:MAG: hypothetical protein R6U31_08355 [bacterium]